MAVLTRKPRSMRKVCALCGAPARYTRIDGETGKRFRFCRKHMSWMAGRGQMIMRRLMTLADVGLGGAEFQMRFEDREQLVLCVAHLAADGHGHHFAVVDEGRSMLMSKMATECLQSAGLLTVLEDTDV